MAGKIRVTYRMPAGSAEVVVGGVVQLCETMTETVSYAELENLLVNLGEDGAVVLEQIPV